ncbi:hypothetical protein BJY01DRAFT_232916 [Aspergillus pseudoustus]|uniref:Zn(2)-C6 fungal-type domain-containing protein n=1 Tax=Aspergillus pseudoustus TaxID=1810923 RepID=A0ABR4KGT6_9EURO
MSLVELAKSAGKRKKVFAPRSRTGCRSCRIRHIRCDESPGQCRNCTSAGWECEGYDVHRLPWGHLTRTGSGVQVAIAMTPDERHSFSYFQHRSIVHLTGLFDSPLWQQHVLQMCHADPAVFHAVNMLGAAHQECELNNMQLVDAAVQSHQVYRFALQQSARAMRLLNQRLSSRSNDPALIQVVLLCCLLFVMTDVLLGRYENAWTHLQCGMDILEDEKTPPVEPSLVAVFGRLDSQAALYGRSQKVLRILQLPQFQEPPPLQPFTTFNQLQSAVSSILATGNRLVATCLNLPESSYLIHYAQLSLAQARLLSRITQFHVHFNRFATLYPATLTEKQRHGLDLLRILTMGHGLVIKISLMPDPLPASLLPEFLAVLEAHEAYIARDAHYHHRRPTLTTDHGIIANAFTLATRAPDIPTRLRGLAVLRAWPHYEGLHNSAVATLLATNALKRHLRENGMEPGPALRTTKQDDAFIGQFLRRVRSGAGKKHVVPLIMAGIC